MSSKKMSCADEIQERLITINLLKVSIRMNSREIIRLNEKKEFMEELVCTYVDKIVRVRVQENLHPLEVNPEISSLRDVITRLHDDIHEAMMKIRSLVKKETEINNKISKLKNEIFDFCETKSETEFCESKLNL